MRHPDCPAFDKGRNLRIGQAFVARDQQRSVRTDHQQGFLEPGIEPGQPVQVRRMLAVAVNHQRVQPPQRHFGPHRRQPSGHLTGRRIRRHIWLSGVRPVDADQSGCHDLAPPVSPKATRPIRLAKALPAAYIHRREVGAGRRLANPVRSGRKQP